MSMNEILKALANDHMLTLIAMCWVSSSWMWYVFCDAVQLAIGLRAAHKKTMKSLAKKANTKALEAEDLVELEPLVKQDAS